MAYAFQSIINIAEICSKKGISHAVISPGSRNAPLTIVFANHPNIECISVVDERSAAFIAMGIAQQTQKTVVLICTSGSAGLNYAPAVAEACFQEIPLLILTADRPPEWIDQLDGQTIRQQAMYGKHAKNDYQLPVDYSHPDAVWHIERTVNEAINLTQLAPKGVVQINCPFREPFYPSEDQEITYDSKVKIIDQSDVNINFDQNLFKEVEQFEKILIVAGQDRFDQKLIDELNEIPFPVVADIISNVQRANHAIKHQDLMLANPDLQKKLGAIDLLITFGKSVLSKNLKIYLRKYKPKQHWHIQEYGTPADPFQSLTKVIYGKPNLFFENLKHFTKNRSSQFLNNWLEADKIPCFSPTFFENQPFSESESIYEVIKYLPDHSILHLANSMAVRYVNSYGFDNQQDIEVFCNRGTSGIDGCLSTAVGHGYVSNKINTLIIGDLSFLYDKNGLWNHCIKNNLRIILINNGGGGIFKMITKPSQLKGTESFFTTPQTQDIELICKQYDLNYKFCADKVALRYYMKDFFSSSECPSLLEVRTDMNKNVGVWVDFKKLFA